jgi:hypothetical protein
MNLEDACINCGQKYMTSLQSYIQYLKIGISFTGNLKGCCENPKKATKADIINKILSEI